MKLFEDKRRIDTEPSLHNDDLYDYYDRSDRPEMKIMNFVSAILHRPMRLRRNEMIDLGEGCDGEDSGKREGANETKHETS